jgi:glycosyltransferase involved in cell wall biosynthesis
VLDAVRILVHQGIEVRLMLLGSPERSAGSVENWLRGASARGLGSAVSVSGTLALQEISNRLAQCDVLLYAHPLGPVSSKGTLASSLASGRPVVALEGEQRWQRLLDVNAASVVPRRAHVLADILRELLDDPAAQAELGARGRAFADTIGPARTAAVVIDLLNATLDCSVP